MHCILSTVVQEERVIKHSYRSVSWSEEKNAFAVVLDQRLCTAVGHCVKMLMIRIAIGLGQLRRFTFRL